MLDYQSVVIESFFKIVALLTIIGLYIRILVWVYRRMCKAIEEGEGTWGWIFTLVVGLGAALIYFPKGTENPPLCHLIGLCIGVMFLVMEATLLYRPVKAAWSWCVGSVRSLRRCPPDAVKPASDRGAGGDSMERYEAEVAAAVEEFLQGIGGGASAVGEDVAARAGYRDNATSPQQRLLSRLKQAAGLLAVQRAEAEDDEDDDES